MVLNVIRAFFVLVMAGIGWYFIINPEKIPDVNAQLAMVFAVSMGLLFVCIDIFSPRRKVAVFSGIVLGLLVGVVVAYALSFVVRLVADQFWQPGAAPVWEPQGSNYIEHYRSQKEFIVNLIDLMIGATVCYLSVSFIIQTKDDFRFVVPYVEFARQSRGTRPVLIDTSALIDGRISDIAAAGFFDTRLIVPQFVLDELQAIADSSDKLRRARGRHGLDALQQLRTQKRADLAFYDTSTIAKPGQADSVDHRLVALAAELNARVLTNDFNLNKVATLRGVDVINLNDLANALKPVVFPGERMTVRILEPGRDPGQGVGYLTDGTMVIVDQTRNRIGEDVEFNVTNVLQTSAGKLIFGRILDSAAPSANSAMSGSLTGGASVSSKVEPGKSPAAQPLPRQSTPRAITQSEDA
jgi:uncharacterized protein YacL